jgi:hypothetical protein
VNTPDTPSTANDVNAAIAERLAPAPIALAEYVEPNPYQRRVLLGLNFSGRHIYGGTVSPSTIAKRRARNKVARAARRINRKAA